MLLTAIQLPIEEIYGRLRKLPILKVHKGYNIYF